MPTVEAGLAGHYLFIQALTQRSTCGATGGRSCKNAKREGRQQRGTMKARITDATHVRLRNSQSLDSSADATGDGAQQGTNAPCCLIALGPHRRAMRTTCPSGVGVGLLVRDRFASLKVVGVSWQLGCVPAVYEPTHGSPTSDVVEGFHAGGLKPPCCTSEHPFEG